MTNRRKAFTSLVLLSVLCQATVSETGDKEIWPIPTECPKTNPLEYTVHLQHETDCTKFYKCDWGKKVLFDCPDGLHFNALLQVCDWPWQAQCTLGEKSSSLQPTTSTPPTPPVDKDPDCPWPDPLDHTVHLPHEEDCSKFYKCDNGKKVEFDCPDGLHFNKDLEVCDWPKNAECENVNPPETSPSAKPTTSTAKPKPEPTPPADKDPECPWPDPLDHTVHLPHESDCTKFYKCDHGKKVEFDCPDGLHFNKELQVCDWPQNAGCENVNPPETSSSAQPTTSTPKPKPDPTPPADKDPECPWPDPLDHTVHLPHESDCTKFYKCDHGKKVEFDCPDGLHFNKELQVCDWPQNAECEDVNPPETSSSAQPTTSTPKPKPEPTPPAEKDPECPWPDPLDHTVHLPHESDCTKFYKCDHGKKVEFDCPDGLHFNKELQVCDWPQNAGCENVNPPETSSSTQPTTSTPKPKPEPTPPADKDPECPWPDPLDHTVHLPHETDCTKFYKCDNGKKVEFDCPDGLHFNKELEVCDWPHNAGCEEVNPKPSSSPLPIPQPTPPADKDPDCPWPDPLNYTVHLPHESDCTKFYKCDHGKKVEFDCPDGLHFNEKLQVCDWPHNAGCENVNPPETSSSAQPTTPTYNPDPKPTPPVDRDPECPWPDPLDHTVHLPHETDCTKFYKCDNGKKVEFDCPDGLHFNKELQVCDWPHNAGCEDVNPKPSSSPLPIPQPTPPADKDPDCPWPDPLNYTVHLPHESDCTKFYKCDHGKKVEFDCPDGLHFNKDLEVCDWPRDAGCEDVNPPITSSSAKPVPTKETTTTPEPKPEPTPPADKDPDCPWPDPLNYTVHLPHETDCSKFYKCDNGKKVEFDCPDGLHFNKDLEVCDWPRDAGCEDVNPPITSSSAKPVPTKETTTTPEPKPEPTPPADKDPDCPWPDPLNYTVHLPHETDCSKFYKCDNGKKVEFDCPDGLHFNKDLEVCDWPRDAGCEDVNPPITSSSAKPVPTEETTTTPEPKPEPTPPADKDPDCPWPDPLNYTVHLPHETDCSKFYKCDNGKKVEFDCPDGLHFNKDLEVCDWPRDAGCEDVNPPITSSSAKPVPTKETTTTPEPKPEPTPPADKDPDCPWPDPLNYTVHLPHETDCSKFYKCDNGKKVEFDCPDGLHFNKDLEVCDWPRDAGCEDVNPPITSSSAKPVPTEETTTTPEPKPEPTPPADKDPDCPWPDPLNYTVHLPHECDCTKFYKCDNGKKVEFDCPDGLHFNQKLEVCDWPEEAGCKDVNPPSPTTSSPTPPDDINPECPWPDPLNHTVHLPHECDCTKFYKCDNGKKVEFDCPDGLHFNKKLEVCDWPENAGCEDVNPEPTPSEEPEPKPEPTPPADRDPDCPWPDPLNYTVHLPHESDCTKFYKCDNGKKVEFDCPDGLHFNQKLEVCDWPQNARCEDIPPPTEPTTTSVPNHCPVIECQDSTIYLPVLSNPRQYIRCVEGVEVLSTCPGGLVFDKYLATCNLEHLIGPKLS